MARTSTQPTTESGLPSLVPHGRFKGKPGITLGRPVTVIGGRSRSHIHLVSQSVSKSHAMVVNTGAGFYVRDLASRTHIFVNGQEVKEAELKDGDILAVGPFTFRFSDPGRRSSSGKRAALPPAVLRMSNSALPLTLDSRVTIIGRRPTCDVVIDEMEVSTTHAVVFEMNGKRYIRDLGSRTGTFVNGTAIHQQPLELGDSFRIGSVELTYAPAAEDELAGIDEMDDLAGTATLPAEEPLDVLPDEPLVRPRGAATLPPGMPPRFGSVTSDNGDAPITSEPSDELDLSLEPELGAVADASAPPMPPPTSAEEPAPPTAESVPYDDLDVIPLEPAKPAAELAPAPVTRPEGATDSRLGIELLPHDEEPVADAPAPVESAAGLSGLDLIPEPTADHEPTPAAEDISADAASEVEVADALELEPVDLDRVEVVDKTEPTPESAIALDLDDEAPTADDVEPQAPGGAEAMTDSVFGREVADFEGPGTGPLVEAPQGADEAAPPAGAAGLELDKELELALGAEDVVAPAESDPLIYEEPAATAPAAEETPAGKRRGGRKAAAPKAKKPATPKRKPPGRKRAGEDEVASAAANEAAPIEPVAEAVSPVDVEPASEEPTPAATLGEITEPSIDLALPEVPESPATSEADPEFTPAAPAEAVASAEAEPEPEALDLDALGIADEPSPATTDLEVPAISEETPASADESSPEPVSGSPALEAAPEEDVVGAESYISPEAAASETVEGDQPASAEAMTDFPPGGGVDDLELSAAEAPTDDAAAPAAEAPIPSDATAAPSSDEPPAPPAPGKPADLFYGLERDTASFLGGMPLQLPPLQSPFAQRTQVDFTNPPSQGRSAPVPQAESELPEAVEADADDEAGAEADLGELDILELDAELEDAAATGEVAADEPSPMESADDESSAEPQAPRAAPAVDGGRTRPAPPPPARFAGGRPGRGGETKRPVSSPFDLNFEDVPTDRIEIPPFAGPGPATRGHVTTAFDGLAMPPVREADVFSQQSVAETTIPPFGGASAPPGADPGAKGRAGEPAGDGDDFADEEQEPLDLSTADDGIAPTAENDLEIAELPDGGDDDEGVEAGHVPPAAAEGRKPRQPSRLPPAYPTDPTGGRAAAAQPKKKKKRWRIGKWGLFGLMLFCMAAASGVIWWMTPALFPNTAKVEAQIKFDKLEAVPESTRQKVLDEQRGKLERREVRASAREILSKQHPGLAPGFLTETGTKEQVTEAAQALSKMTGGMRLVERKAIIQLEHRAVDGDGDRARVASLLEALYVENKPLIDAAGKLQTELQKKQSEQMQAEFEFQAIKPAADTARAQSGDAGALRDKQSALEALQRKERELSKAWDDTTARVRQLAADALAAESSVPFDPAGDPANIPPVADEDPQVVEMARKAEDLAATLAERKQQRTARADEARTAMDTALKQFEDDIAKARAEMKPDSELGRYLTAAADVQRQLKIVSGDLAQQQRSDMDRLTMLKRKLAEKNEERIRKAFASDPDLQGLQEDLALKERQFNTAVHNGLKDDASAIGKEVKGLKVEIESRQDLLTTADGVAPGVKELEEFINETLGRMEKDRARNDRIMAENLKELAAKAPAAGSLPKEQKAFAEQLERRQAELNKARERYTAVAKAAEAEADEAVKDLEGELSTVQAKIDERKKQVADAARKSLSADQQKERVAATQAARLKLDAARRADEKASAAYLAHRQELAKSEDELERMKRRSEAFERGNRDVTLASNRIKAMSDEVERLRRQVATSVVPQKPGDEDVKVTDKAPDSRPTYMLGTCLVIGIGFFALVRIAPLHPDRMGDDEDAEWAEDDALADEGDVPFASAARPDAPAAAAAAAVEDATARRQRRRGEESPLTV